MPKPFTGEPPVSTRDCLPIVTERRGAATNRPLLGDERARLSGKVNLMSLSQKLSARALIAVGLFAVALTSGCNKPKRNHSKTAAPAASGSAAAGTAAATADRKSVV